MRLNVPDVILTSSYDVVTNLTKKKKKKKKKAGLICIFILM